MITDLPPVPSRADPSTFSAKSDLFLGALDTFGTELNATREDVNLSQTQASASKTSASTSATNANASANNASTYAANALVNANAAAANTNAPLWVSGTTYALGRLVYSAVTGRTYRRIVAGAGTTDPSSDTVNWTVLGLDINTSYPVLRPTLNLNFTSEAIDPRITFTRASTATRTNSKGLIENSEVNAPRFDYDPVTLACKGLLIEEARTNLLTYSEQFDNAIWLKGGTTTISSINSVLAPDNTLTADVVSGATDDAHNGNNLIYSLSGLTSGGTYTITVWYLSAGSTTFSMRFRDGLGVSTLTGALTATGTWKRASLTFTLGAITTGNLRIGGTNGNIALWGAQLETGAFPTSYIPTTSSTVTRAADVAVMTGSNFSSWYRADEGSFVFNAAMLNVLETNPRLLCADGGASSSNIRFAGSTFQVIDASSVTQCSISGGTLSNGVYSSLVGAYKVDDFATSKDGGTVLVDTSGTVPTVDRLVLLGSSASGTTCGWIKHLRYYPKRLSNSELAQISTL